MLFRYRAMGLGSYLIEPPWTPLKRFGRQGESWPGPVRQRVA
jgi:hypothetical protein